MAFKDAYIPYGAYWSTPFCRWQGSFQNQHSIRFAAEAARRFLDEKMILPKEFDEVVLGTTVPQQSSFYGTPWLAGMLGADHATGPMIGQACATSAKCVDVAAHGVDSGSHRSILVVCADRCSNGPLLVYPNPQAPGATMDRESWVWDNFGNDPFAKNSMLQTAENVAKEAGIAKEEQDKLAFLRHTQYQDALRDDRAFQRRYMLAPMDVKDARGKAVLATVKGDEGVFPTTMESLQKIKPVLPEGTVSYGTQTFPADGNCGLVVTSRENAKRLRKRDDVEIRVASFAEARTKKGFMAMAVVPAARKALEGAGISMKDVSATKTHNPFAVNDVYFCREMDLDWKAMNNYGCSLVFGHPQGPTGLRLLIELAEELVLKGGGYGLFDGCAAGDTAASVVIEVRVG